MADLDYDALDYFRSEELLADPYPYFEHLRGKCPIHQEPHHDVFMVTGYEELVAIEADSASFSNANSVSGPFPGLPVEVAGDDITDVIEQCRGQLPMANNVVTMDPPSHTAHRGLLMRHFTPKRLAETETFMTGIADQLIDEFAATGACEFVTAFSGPFALLNICALLGVPEEDHDAFREDLLGEHRDRGLGNIKAQTPDDPFAFLRDKFTVYLEDRLANPREDILTSLATSKFPDGSTPDLADLVTVATTLFAAGTGTTTHTLAAALRFIAERPDLQQALRDDPSRIPAFGEETLRLEGPVLASFRLSRLTSTVADVELRAGSTSMLCFAAANRDPRRFDDPEEFRLDRPNGRHHLAFGHGIHTCAGAALARAETRIGIERMLTRLDDIRISEAHHGPPDARRWEYPPSFQLRGPQAVHLEFTPAGRA